jgi:hypothetical protein
MGLSLLEHGNIVGRIADIHAALRGAESIALTASSVGPAGWFA